jgi:hypothetical protein
MHSINQKIKNIDYRLIGALAIRTQCPQFGYIQDDLGRVFTDIEFCQLCRVCERYFAFVTGVGL